MAAKPPDTSWPEGGDPSPAWVIAVLTTYIFSRTLADGCHLAYGRTAAGRLLFAVYVQLPAGKARVLTAREMAEKEKRFYRKKRKARG